MGAEKLDKVITRLEALAGSKMEDFVENAAEENFHLMESLNRAQLMEGIRSDGSKIEPPYAIKTTHIKRAKGQPYDRVTLYDEGDYQAAIKATDVNKKVIALESSDWKAEELIAKYGPNIEGLTDENIEIASEAMLPSLEEQTRKYLKI
jgi:hypothetical protein